MGLQETTDIIVTFFQNVVLLVDIPNVNLTWPPVLNEPIKYIKMLVSFELIKTLASQVSSQVEELDIHVMLGLKNAFLPFLVAVAVIVPLQRWYYVVWWIFTLVAAVGATLALSATSFFAQQADSITGIKLAHQHGYIYKNSYDPSLGMAPVNFNFLHTSRNQMMIIGAGSATAVIVVSFFALISIGILVWIISILRARKARAKALALKQKEAPPGKKVNKANFDFQYNYNMIEAKVKAEKELNKLNYITRIAPVLFVILGALIAGGILIYFYVTVPDTTNTGTSSKLMIFIISMACVIGVIVLALVLIGMNSLVLLEKPRLIIYKVKQFITSKALKLVFLVVSSFYIPLAVQIFTMFDCTKITCDAGQVFSHRKDNSAHIYKMTQFLSKLLSNPATCTSCNFAQTATAIVTNSSASNATTTLFGGLNATVLAAANQGYNGLCNITTQALKDSICPSSTEYRLLRSSNIACSTLYPYVGVAAGLSLIFVITTPFLILYLIYIATKMLNTVIVSHLLDYRRRQLMRARMRRSRFGRRKPDWINFKKKLAALSKQDATVLYNQTVKEVKLKHIKDVKWEMSIHLVDCSIESLYFPYKYFFRYYKLLFMFAKVVLAFTNVFGLTLFGFVSQESKIGAQVVLWATFGVQFLLGLITIVIRPHMILAESLLMMLSSISICANCLFGAFLLYSQMEVPWYITTAFMGANSLILGAGAAASLFFYFYRIIKNNYKSIQNKMKSQLKAQVSRILTARKKKRAAELKKYRKSRKKPPRSLFRKKENITPAELMPGDKAVNRYFKLKKEPLLPVYPSRFNYETVKSYTQYQKTVAFTLNSKSLNLLINYFFILSVISVVAGLLIAVHFFLQFTSTHYTDPYIQTPIEAFRNPLTFKRVFEYTDVDFNVPHTSSQFRNETEVLLEKYAAFQRFPYNYCPVAFDYHFAGYDTWNEFADNCCCSRDHEYEKDIKISGFYGMQDTLVADDNLIVENWRCKNGFVKRHLRQVHFNLTQTDPIPSEFRFKANNTIFKDYVLNGFQMRGLCSKQFNAGFDMSSFNRTTTCAKLTAAGTDAVADAPTFMIAPKYQLLSSFMYQGFAPRVSGNYSTTGYTDRPISEQNKNFWGTTMDAYFSLLTRSFLY